MTKSIERNEARRLRCEEGLSLKEICDVLHVSKSSASVWVRDLPLTDNQKEILIERTEHRNIGRITGGKANAIKAREKRKLYQEEGRLKARKNDPLHIAGCMLYWGEGAKGRGQLKLSNPDFDLMQFYMRFLRESLMISDDRMSFRVHCYIGNGISLEEIENHWLTLLQLPQNCFRKSIVNLMPNTSQQKGRKLYFGVCHVSVISVRDVQHVFGAIQAYIGIDKPEWLD